MEIVVPYTTPDDLAKVQQQEADAAKKLRLTPFNVQEIVFELIRNYMLANSGEDEGYSFKQKYNVDASKSDIVLDIAYNWKAKNAEKLPAIFVQRGDAKVGYPTMGQAVSRNPKESEETRMGFVSFNIEVACIATTLGLTEQFADYVRQPLMLFRNEIKEAFGFRKFSLNEISKPTIYVEGSTMKAGL
ncbi:MAG: hypothetical protein EBU46_02945 [Nitrosomonadaceae bacterium]|nr:hypothetical protein [Nitrosomonadaceae bacterium]